MSEIPATPADGNLAVWVIPTVADLKAPTVAELSAATVIDISCYLTGSGLADSADQATIADDRACDTIDRQLPGRVSPSLELTFIDNTNTEVQETFNEAVEALAPNSTYVVGFRRGIAFDAPVAAAQKVNLRRVVGGIHNPVAMEANSVLRSTAKQFIQGFANNVAVVAGS